MKPFLLKIHLSENGNVAAACDAELLGKTFSGGEACLDVDADFFGGEDAASGEIVGAVISCTTANIVGNRIASELLKSGVIKESGVKEIKGVKYAMVFKV